MIRVMVLMSSYNGEKYIKQQIDSILSQRNVIVDILVRDDGSTDSTQDILNDYQSQGVLRWYTGKNLKPAKSFIHLIENCNKADYYALADQDDIWHDDKLIRAVSMLENEKSNIPLLYGANQNCVDADGNFTGVHFSENIVEKLDIIGVVMQNYIAGCTMVFNNKLRNVLVSQNSAREIAYFRMHDTWIMLCALIKGKFVYDNEPVMEYRRHDKNYTDGSIKQETLNHIINLFRVFIYNGNKAFNYRSDTAILLLKNFSMILDRDVKLKLEYFMNYQSTLIVKFKLIKLIIHDKKYYKIKDVFSIITNKL